MREDEKERFVIGVLHGQSLDPSVLATIMNLTNDLPACEVGIRKLGQDVLLRDLLDEKIDAAITLVPDGEAPDDRFDIMAIRRVRMHLLAAENDPVWDGKADLQALDRRVLIIQGEDHPAFTTLIREIKAAGVLPQIKVAPKPETAEQWLETGVGVSITDDGEVIYLDRVRRELASKPLQGVPGMTIVLMRKKEHKTRATDVFCYYMSRSVSASESESVPE